MSSNPIDMQKFLLGLKYGLIAEAILTAFFLLLWYLSIGTIATFPIAFFTFGVGGILFLISGCIGPGKFIKNYDLLLYTPEAGSSFSDEITVSGFLIDETITSANIMVNGQKAGTLEFNEATNATTTISRKDFIYNTINVIYLQVGDKTSNTSEFTLFEYTEDMTAEEVEELHEMETREPEKKLEVAERDYKEKISGRVGSVAMGLLFLGVLNFVLVFVLGRFYQINF